MDTLNQTNVELKLAYSTPIAPKNTALNQTNVELKQRNTLGCTI